MADVEAAHTHCDGCFKHWCSAEADPGVSCSNICCPQECGARLHTCKLTDHLTRCLNTRVQCPNSVSGCPASMIRKMVAAHLIHCPANVIQCGLEFRMDEFMQHFSCGVEHNEYCNPILAEKIARKMAAEKLAEEAEYDPNLPVDNYVVLSSEERVESLEKKQKKREEALKSQGSLLVRPRPSRSGNDLCKVPWHDTNRLLSEDVEQFKVPTSPVEEIESSPMSPTSPLPPDSPLVPSLESLPFQVLKNIGRFCDARDLSALSLTSKFLRRVCASLLQECGMVMFHWDKQVDDTWVVTQKVWQFSIDPSSNS